MPFVCWILFFPHGPTRQRRSGRCWWILRPLALPGDNWRRLQVGSPNLSRSNLVTTTHELGAWHSGELYWTFLRIEMIKGRNRNRSKTPELRMRERKCPSWKRGGVMHVYIWFSIYSDSDSVRWNDWLNKPKSGGIGINWYQFSGTGMVTGRLRFLWRLQETLGTVKEYQDCI